MIPRSTQKYGYCDGVFDDSFDDNPGEQRGTCRNVVSKNSAYIDSFCNIEKRPRTDLP
jgi:hypothetical protein